ncbi:MAG TPA: gluconate 2-dehydrogenase subunit 3 family protein [Woeseiaceae bacterium]|nr:gluconate 2-dehydrogenase subunit 3 family protein [Woeseiaceae bacterium]
MTSSNSDSDSDSPMRVDRRTTLKWLAAAMAAAHAGCTSKEKYLGDEIPAAPGQLLGTAAAPAKVGYGTDIDLMNPTVPWPRTMTEAQLRTASALCDLIVPEDERSPAASAVGVPDFIDEWVSAPYPAQQSDRETILGGLEWLEQQSRDRFGSGFADAEDRQQAELLDRMASSDVAKQVEFFERFRFITVGAFYTTEEGMKDVGYIGNVAIHSEYPGPSDEAMTHLAGVLEQLGLQLPA